MEETKKTKASKPEKSKKDNKKEKKGSDFFAAHKAELKKVTWPNREELAKETVTVIVLSLIIGVIIFGMDTLLAMGYNRLINVGSSNTASDISSAQPVDLSDLANMEGIEVLTGDDADLVSEPLSAAGEADTAAAPAAEEAAPAAEDTANEAAESADNAANGEENAAAENEAADQANGEASEQ